MASMLAIYPYLHNYIDYAVLLTDRPLVSICLAVQAAKAGRFSRTVLIVITGRVNGGRMVDESILR